MWFAGKEGDGKINQVQATKRSVSVHKLTICMDCATGCCFQARKRWENQSSSGNKEVSECAQTYRLHRLCHRMWFADKERDGKINQVQATKGSVSVHKLTVCIDCATGCGLQTRKEIGKSIKFRQQRGQ